MSPNLSQAEYRDLRAAYAEHARAGGSGLYQSCNRCGNCEYAGGFCSWCTTGDYTLTAHTHGPRTVCPVRDASTPSTGEILGTYRHPLNVTIRRLPREVAS